MKIGSSIPFALSLVAAPLLAQDEQGETTPLFASEALLEVTLDGPFREIARRSESSTDSHPATLGAAGEVLSVQASARGISRRRKDKCSFPPLRIVIPDKPPDTSLFHKQSGIKLVTHCKDSAAFEQLALREYTAYRLYNVLTPESLRVRLARITYRDGDKILATRLGFFIEDGDDAARRLGMKEVDIGNVRVSALNRADAARYSLFQYMIGNTDWAMDAGPDPGDCCHNSKLFGANKDATDDLTPVPYDFDNAGLVDAPYAVPSEKLRIRSVTKRVWRGYCAFNGEIPGHATQFRMARPALEAEIARIVQLEERTRNTMLRYLEGFFEKLDDEAGFAARLAKDCL